MRIFLTTILSLLFLTTPLFGQSSKPLGVEKSQQGVLYEKKVNGVWKWFKNGNKKTDEKYVGEIRNGLPNGQGTFTWSSGSKYVGEFKDGKRNGQGTFTLPDGSMYVGEWKDWKPDGQGTLISPNGEKYAGKWKDGKRKGQGTFTYSDGDKYVGEYKDGKPWNGNIYGIIVNGVGKSK